MQYNLSEFPKSEKLVKQFYPNSNSISFEKYVNDPFFEEDNMKQIFSWYQSKNPTFEIMSNIIVQMPEYNVLMAGIIKDVYIYLKLFISDTVPKEIIKKKYSNNLMKKNNSRNLQNIKNCSSILEKIEIMIENGYLYSLIIDIIYDYLFFFDKKTLNNEEYLITNTNTNFNKYQKNRKMKRCDRLLKYYKSQYIIFPCFKQIDLYKVILNMKAPVLNFLMTNGKHKTHGSTVGVSYELIHDIEYHYNPMIISFFNQIMMGRHIKNDNEKDNFVKLINRNKELFATYFVFMNKFIGGLENSFIYSIPRRTKNIGNLKKTTYENLKEHPDFIKYMNCFVLFYIFHEVKFFEECFNRMRTIYFTGTNILLIETNNSEIILKYIMINYFKIVANELLRYNKSGNNRNISFIKDDFIDLVKDTLFINTGSDDSYIEKEKLEKYVFEIIKLYKNSVNFIDKKIIEIFGF